MLNPIMRNRYSGVVSSSEKYSLIANIRVSGSDPLNFGDGRVVTMGLGSYGFVIVVHLRCDRDGFMVVLVLMVLILDVNITLWIQEISASFKCLKSLHIRNVAIHDSDLKLLARTRGKDLKVLKIVGCEGISESGLMHISKGCNELRTLCLDRIDQLDEEEGCVKWSQELALRNTGIETFSFRYFCDRLDVKDVALLVKNCSKSLVSLEVNTSYIDDLADAFSHAVKLEHFSGRPLFYLF
ncbi:hypothetical protein Tco_1554447 [Tanacetum coccineum]